MKACYNNDGNSHRSKQNEECLGKQHAEYRPARSTVTLHGCNRTATLGKRGYCQQHIVEACYNKCHQGYCRIYHLHLLHITIYIYCRCKWYETVCNLPLLAMLLNAMPPYELRHCILNLGNIGTLAQLDECSVTLLSGPYLIILVIRQVLKDIKLPYRLVHAWRLKDTGNDFHSQLLAKRILIAEHLFGKTLRNHYLACSLTLTAQYSVRLTTDNPKVKDIEKSAVGL